MYKKKKKKRKPVEMCGRDNASRRYIILYILYSIVSQTVMIFFNLKLPTVKYVIYMQVSYPSARRRTFYTCHVTAGIYASIAYYSSARFSRGCLQHNVRLTFAHNAHA